MSIAIKYVDDKSDIAKCIGQQIKLNANSILDQPYKGRSVLTTGIRKAAMTKNGHYNFWEKKNKKYC